MFTHYDNVSWAVFNSTKYDYRLGRQSVKEKFGQNGWDKVKKIIKEGGGIMTIFDHPPTPETKLFAYTVGMSAECRTNDVNTQCVDWKEG